MNTLIQASLNRIRASVRSVYGLGNLDEWICENTYLNGKKFSFEDYEFQIPIARDSSRTSIIIKPAQIGMSELSYRYAIASCCVMDNWNLIYTFPTSGDASKNATTRIDPLIQGSPEVKRLVNPNLNNSETKQFGENSFLFFKGTLSATQALSTPANMVVHDEWDKSDTTQGSVYVSRLQNRPDKLRRIFSTPTIDKYGVSLEAQTAVRMMHLATCEHCNHTFLPDYYENVIVPGWDKPLDEITKNNIHTTKWRDAYLACPNCGRDPNLHHTRMQYVAENSNENHTATAWFISPFSAHKILSPAYLVQASTQFAKKSEFVNQSLGKTAIEVNEQLQESDIVTAFHPNLQSSELCVMGSDMGVICHTVVSRVASDGTFLIVHKERIHYSAFEKRTLELTAKYRVMLHVMDTQPYVDLVTRLTEARPNNWGAIFVTSKSPLMFNLQNEDKEVAEGRLGLKLVKINRTAALDGLLAVIKEGAWAIQTCELDNEYKTQMLSMKRVQKFTKEGELNFIWDKTDGADHMHMATLYSFIATKMRGTVGGMGAVSTGMALIRRTRAPQYPTHGGEIRR